MRLIEPADLAPRMRIRALVKIKMAERTQPNRHAKEKSTHFYESVAVEYEERVRKTKRPCLPGLYQV